MTWNPGGIIVAVVPIVGGNASMGSTARMITELGSPVSALSVVQHHADLLDDFVVDPVNASGLEGLRSMDVTLASAHSTMVNLDDRTALARTVLQAADRIPHVTGTAT